MDDYDERMAQYELDRDNFLAAGLGGLLPAGFDKEHVQIARGEPTEAFYRPTLDFSAMRAFKQCDDGTWIEGQVHLGPLGPPE